MAQKAYSPDRYMHEAIINTVVTIKHCQRENVEGVLLSVDLHKAFDSVLHEFTDLEIISLKCLKL
jgi:hypothetical protein